MLEVTNLETGFPGTTILSGISFELDAPSVIGLVGPNGCGKTTFVMAQGIAGAFLVRIPVSFLMSRIQPVSLFLVGLATPCSTVVQILLCAGYFYLLGRKRRKAGSL